VTGVCGDMKISSEARVNLDDGSDGDSFIPRLWARHHLDHLLAQGSSAKNKARIVALSEEFQIATPYTSFLVLESDADRERFAVQKRLRMRDGEEFFAKGRTDAAFELARQQVQKAVAWHRDLRLDTLKSLVAMDRGLVELLRQGSRFGEVDSLAGAVSLGGWGYSTNDNRMTGGPGNPGGPSTGGRGALRGMAKSKDRFQERQHGTLRRENAAESKLEADGDKGGVEGGDEESSDLDDSNALEPPGEAEPEDLSLQEAEKEFVDGATAWQEGDVAPPRTRPQPRRPPPAPTLKQLGYARGDRD
jgi:hypothetical protein